MIDKGPLSESFQLVPVSLLDAVGSPVSVDSRPVERRLFWLYGVYSDLRVMCFTPFSTWTVMGLTKSGKE